MQTRDKDLKYYMSVAYPVRLTRRTDDDVYWFAEIPDLPGCMADGATPDEAIAELEEAKELWIETHIADGLEVPEPADLMGYSGKLSLRIPKSLHRRLADQAKQEGVSLNQHILNQLASQQITKDQIIHEFREVADRLMRSRPTREFGVATQGRQYIYPTGPQGASTLWMGLTGNAVNIHSMLAGPGAFTSVAVVTDDTWVGINNSGVPIGNRGATIGVGAE